MKKLQKLFAENKFKKIFAENKFKKIFAKKFLRKNDEKYISKIQK
jgi:hypothetical protein